MNSRILSACLGFLLLTISSVLSAQQVIELRSPGGNNKLKVELTSSGGVSYSLDCNNKKAILPSGLGFIFSSPAVTLNHFRLVKFDSTYSDNAWKPVWGEQASIRNQYKELFIQLKDISEKGYLLNIRFRLFNDGLGFRYEFPIQPNLQYFVVKEELTEFALSGDHKAFWLPGDFDSQEYTYTTSPLSQVDSWKSWQVSSGGREQNVPDQYAVQTPLMLKSADGLYINIHEAALVDYPAMLLHVDRDKHVLSSNLVPDPMGNKAYLRTAAKTPWRTIVVSDKATDILASKMILNLNEPSVIPNTSWIKPMKFVGIWWLMQTGKGSWNYTDYPDSTDAKGNKIPNGRHAATTANVKKYIDFAAKHKIGGVLVEGWNTGWEAWYGNWYGRHFDFVTPYPDFNVVELMNYAKQKGVQIIMHNETSADAAGYDQQMDTAYEFMNRFGYHAVKTGYVGQIIPRGEHHDGQWMVNHYIRAAAKAAKHHVMIDMHEPVRPTGLHRTYPNFIASEAARGNEFNAFAEGSPPEHETILPFTRLMGGPMDYTPGIFKLQGYAANDPNRQMHSTLAKHLALYITMYSPLQMAADLPENYDKYPDAFRFIEMVPVDWDDSRILEAEPGDYITIARQEKGKDNWYLGAVTDENSRMVDVALDFLKPGVSYEATIYRDGDQADWKTKPESYKIEKIMVNSTSRMKVKLAPGGGLAVSIIRK